MGAAPGHDDEGCRKRNVHRLPEEISAVGIAEKSFKKRKPTPEEEAAGKKDERFISVMVDHGTGRLLDVVPGRSEESGTAFIDKALLPWQQFYVGAVKIGKALGCKQSFNAI